MPFSKLRILVLAFAGFAFSSAVHAQTGVCNDGTTTSAQSKRGACSGHGGVKTWTGPAAATSTTPPAPAATTTAKPVPAPAPIPSSAQKGQVSAPAAAAPAQGGGPGMVWVNLPTKVYHCAGARYYGTTKNGKYMSEADAKAMGARPDHGKPCS